MTPATQTVLAGCEILKWLGFWAETGIAMTVSPRRVSHELAESRADMKAVARTGIHWPKTNSCASCSDTERAVTSTEEILVRSAAKNRQAGALFLCETRLGGLDAAFDNCMVSSCPLVDLPGANRSPRGHSTSLTLPAEALGSCSYAVSPLCTLQQRFDLPSRHATRLDTISCLGESQA